MAVMMAAPLPALLDKNGSKHAVWQQISQTLCLHPGAAGPACQPLLPVHCHWLLAGSATTQVCVVSLGLCLHGAASGQNLGERGEQWWKECDTHVAVGTGVERIGCILHPASPAVQAAGKWLLHQHRAGGSAFHLSVSHLAEEETSDSIEDVEVAAVPLPCARGAPMTVYVGHSQLPSHSHTAHSALQLDLP